MKIRSLFYHIKDGLKNIYRNRLFSLASIATITACIFLFGVFYALVSNFQYMIHKAENEVCVTVFFDEGLTDADIKKLGDTISQRNEESRIHYKSADEAWENYKAEYFKDYPELAEGFKDDNPLANSSSYEIYLNEASSQATLVTYLENLDGIRQVNRSEATASGLASAARLVSYITIAIIVILLAVSIFLITNTIVIGITVSGSDVSDSAVLQELRNKGAAVFIGHKRENINNADVLVVSSAIGMDNPELQEAKSRDLPIFHRSDVLAAIFKWGKGIAVAGAHGKSTTSAMIGQIFHVAKMDPTIVLGGFTDYLKGNSCLGHGEHIIAEADESDGSFLIFATFLSVVTNIEDDHLDHYGTVENIRKAFVEFLNHVTYKDGGAIVCIDSEGVQAILPQIKKKVISFGINDSAEYRAVNKRYEKQNMLFDVYHYKEKLGTVSLQIPGIHNVRDALGAIVVALYCGISFETSVKALSVFSGVKRLFQTKMKEHGVWIVDDYAHHPTEIAATLKAAKEMGRHRVICAFQPHRYSRTKLLQEEFSEAFIDADVLFFTDIYAAGESPIQGIDGTLIPNLVKRRFPDKPINYVKNVEDLPKELYKVIKPDDMLITMGAGNIYMAGEMLANLMKGKGLSSDYKK